MDIYMAIVGLVLDIEFLDFRFRSKADGTGSACHLQSEPWKRIDHVKLSDPTEVSTFRILL